MLIINIFFYKYYITNIIWLLLRYELKYLKLSYYFICTNNSIKNKKSLKFGKRKLFKKVLVLAKLITLNLKKF